MKSTIEKYKMASRKEKILVACSGGKDSTALALILKKNGFAIEALHIDLGLGEYSRNNRDNLAKFCKENFIKLNLVNFREEAGFSLLKALDKCLEKGESPCSICGPVKKSILNRKAREMGFTKIATGHNLDDECQGIIMNIFRSSPSASNFGPSSNPKKDSGLVTRIKPLFFCAEEDVRKYARMQRLHVSGKICPYSVNVYRREIKNRLDVFEKKIPGAKNAIVKNFISVSSRFCKKERELGRCLKCGEPSSGETCMSCKAICKAVSLLKERRQRIK